MNYPKLEKYEQSLKEAEQMLELFSERTENLEENVKKMGIEEITELLEFSSELILAGFRLRSMSLELDEQIELFASKPGNL